MSNNTLSTLSNLPVMPSFNSALPNVPTVSNSQIEEVPTEAPLETLPEPLLETPLEMPLETTLTETSPDFERYSTLSDQVILDPLPTPASLPLDDKYIFDILLEYKLVNGIDTEVNLLSNVHPSTISYLKLLVEPFYSAVSSLTDTRDLLVWILEKVGNPFFAEFGVEDPNSLLTLSIEEVYKSLMFFILKQIIVHSPVAEYPIVPWDIASGMISAYTTKVDNPVLVHVFTLLSYDRPMLPVIVHDPTNDSKFTTHQLSYQYTLGILTFLFVNNLLAQRKITLFDHVLNPIELLKPSFTQLTPTIPHEYRVTLKGGQTTIYFDSDPQTGLDFLTGFNTCSEVWERAGEYKIFLDSLEQFNPKTNTWYAHKL